MDHHEIQARITKCHYLIWQWEEERQFLQQLCEELTKDIEMQKAEIANLDGQYYKARRNSKQPAAARQPRKVRRSKNRNGADN